MMFRFLINYELHGNNQAELVKAESREQVRQLFASYKKLRIAVADDAKQTRGMTIPK